MTLHSGLVLAGAPGVATRTFHGRPLLSFALDALAPLCGELLVAHGAFVEPTLARVVEDAGAALVADEGTGALAGLVAGAARARGERLLVAPSGKPFLTSALYEELLAAIGAREGAIASVDGRPLPLVAALRRDAALRALRAGAWLGARDAGEALRGLEVALVPVAAQDVADA